ncbi:cation:proton antiporter regulatory subunit [Qingrenia yutianensis]|uniref:cation:proton antiporter regulatory subunit n=1 Tax=Qingrenia yutianensis TaxID=2763676 RepID=UPI003743524E
MGRIHAIFEVEAPKQWIGKTIGDIDIRRKYNINVLAVKKNGDIDMAISSDTTLSENATLMVLGEYKELQKCFRI